MDGHPTNWWVWGCEIPPSGGGAAKPIAIAWKNQSVRIFSRMPDAWVGLSSAKPDNRSGEEAIYAAVMPGFVPQPDLQGCRLGIEIEIQIEIVIRGRGGQFDFDADFDFDDDQVGVRLCGSVANYLSGCLLGTLYTKATCDCPGAGPY
jgi:hypothetical protein